MIPSHQLTFYGAAQEVTGSCHLLETCGKRYLLDCGILQGEDAAERDFDFDPASISAVILSHVHLDHSGRLPRLGVGTDAEIDVSMNLWNDAKDRWYAIVNLLRGWPGIGVEG